MELSTYPFVLKLVKKTPVVICRHFLDLFFMQCILTFHMSLLIKSVLRALKRDLERVALITEGEIRFLYCNAC